MEFKTFALIFSLISHSTFLLNAQKIIYLNGIFEDEVCEISEGVSGTCQKISECTNEYENYRKNQGVLNICNYDKITANILVCCPQNNMEQLETFQPTPMNISKTSSTKKLNLLDFETCRDEFLPYRKLYINNEHFKKALMNKDLPLTKENCDLLRVLNDNNTQRAVGSSSSCTSEGWNFSGSGFYGSVVPYGDRPNMAAIGIVQNDKKIVYICGGSVITDRFVITAAHCKFQKGKQVNKVRVGDRYLISKEDDETAQQFNIQYFISHPNFKANLKYNDIAMIKTVETIEFSSNVVPSCIGDMNYQIIGIQNKLTVAGYGQTEDGVASNILLEIGAHIISNNRCNEAYEDIDGLPYGIIDSQICVESPKLSLTMFQDTCYGDSGSPLQFKTEYEVFPDDFKTTYISKIYISSTVLGIVSFGIGCGLEIPSVYTKLDPFRDWMRFIVENY